VKSFAVKVVGRHHQRVTDAGLDRENARTTEVRRLRHLASIEAVGARFMVATSAPEQQQRGISRVPEPIRRTD